LIGGRTRIRTLDPLIKSQLLYQLSYAPSKPGFREAGSGLDIKLVQESKGMFSRRPDNRICRSGLPVREAARGRAGPRAQRLASNSGFAHRGVVPCRRRREVQIRPSFAPARILYSSWTSASTRNGLPDPCSIFSGAAKITAPVAGSWSRLVRLARPKRLAPCIRLCAGNAGSNACA
jgi:hypothetical protein